ncbi:MAG: glycosyltransferase family 2 protein [Agathobacter sp.]|nr:glycosyltransferase family 2 protein [Agathobacter sp.]
MEKISVIVPVYNMENYLEKCLNSIVRQTYSDLEIIIIDDGSKDNSSIIYNKFKRQDSRILIIKKSNGGLSDARNFGIINSTGKYICFIDSDDYVEADYIEKMYNAIKKYNADICCCGKIIEKKGKKIYANVNSEFLVNSVDALKLYLQKKEIDNSAWDKLYKRDLFKDVEFPVGRYYEDIGTIYKLFIASNNIVHIKNPLYHYVIREESISHEKYSEKQLDSLYMTKTAVKDITMIYPQLTEYATAYYALELLTTLRRIYHSLGKKEIYTKYNSVFEEYCKNYKYFIYNRYIPFFK